MKRSTTLILSLVFVLASCGTSSQFAEQRFVDGIYSKPAPTPAKVQLYSEDDFAAMAADNIEREKILDDDNSDFLSGLALGLSLGSDWWDPYPWGWRYHHWYRFDPWYRNYWYHYGPWYYDHWYYSPWYYSPWYYSPWHYGWHGGWYDPWYYDWHYHHYPHYHYPVGIPPRQPGLSPSGRTYYGPRMDTQTGGSRVSRPGSSRSNYRRGTNGSYGSSGATVIGRPSTGTSVRPSSTTVRPGTSSGRPSGNYNYSRVVPRQNSNTERSTTTATPSTSRSSSNYNYSRGSSSGFSGGGMSSGFGGGGSSSRSGGGGGGSRGGGGRR